jgi:hypothetical protein
MQMQIHVGDKDVLDEAKIPAHLGEVRYAVRREGALKTYVLGPHGLWYLLDPETDERSDVGVPNYALPTGGQMEINCPWEFDLVDGQWVLLEQREGCTCAGGPPFGHESHCGYEYVGSIEEMLRPAQSTPPALDLQAVVRRERARADAAEAALAARPAPVVNVADIAAIIDPEAVTLPDANPVPNWWLFDMRDRRRAATNKAVAIIALLLGQSRSSFATVLATPVADAPAADGEGGQER